MIGHRVAILAAVTTAATLGPVTPALSQGGPGSGKHNHLSQSQKEAGWQRLFNGRDLEGWSVRSGFARYRVEDGAIVGRTAEGSPNTFLTTDKQFADFVLRFEVKLDDPPLNSGVQIRSKLKGEKHGGRLQGPQVEIEHRDGGDSGYIYGEALGTGWLSEPRTKHEHFRDGAWNEYRVRVVGDRIRTWLNGKQIADLELPPSIAKQHRRGRIGLQVHGVGDRGPFEVRWRDIYLKPIE